VPAEPLFIADERAALSGFRAGYSGLTRHAYTLDLRQYAACCAQHRLYLFTARRADIECFDRDMEAKGAGPGDDRSPAVHHRGVLPLRRREDLLEHSPAAHVRRPRLDYESHAAGLDPQRGRRAAGRRRPRRRGRARAAVTAGHQRAAHLRGPRRRHRRPRPRTRAPHPDRAAQGGKIVTIPLAHAPPAPSTSRSANASTGRSSCGPTGSAWTGTPPAGSSAASPKRGGIDKKIGPHTLRHAFITAALDAGVPLRHVQEAASHADPRTTMRYERARVSLDRHATYIVAAYLAGAAR
jgi:hypothetical protein